MRRRWAIALGLGVLMIICAVAWRAGMPSEPTYDGMRLSAWLDDLSKLDSVQQRSKGAQKQIKAIRAIGTNAIPFLLGEYRQKGDAWKWRVNQLLNKQHFIKARFPDPNVRLRRATFGFRALGEIGEPAIPDLLSLVEATPGYVPGALAAIGRPAIPALQRCLTNMTPYTNSMGTYAIIPGNTVSEIFNATSLGPFSKADVGVFLPQIRAWSRQTTNTQAQSKAQFFLDHYDALPD
jgi:hypothetical protein